jgi:MATE family multidrug resistance protein
MHDIRRIAALAWPVLIGQLAIIAFGVIDTAMVGRYSALDLAALGLGASIYISIYIALTGILVALQPIAGQLFGAQRHGEIGEAVRQAAWLALALALLGMVLLAFPTPLLKIAHASPQLTERTLAYLRLLALGLPASLMFRIYNALSNAIAKPRYVMAIQLAALALKIPANAWFIFGGWGVPALGGVGCALASTLINWCTCLLALALLLRQPVYRRLEIFARFSRPSWTRQAELLKLGIPMGLSYLIEVTAYTFMALFIARFGTTQLAGHQIAGNLGAVLYMTPLSIGIATSTLVAQHLGARQADQARTISRHGIMLAGGVALCYCAVVIASRTWLVKAYTSDQAVAAAALPLLLLVAFYHIWDALQICTAFVLRAYKIAVAPTLIYAVALWGVGLGGGYWLGFNVPGTIAAALTGARGFWFANMLSVAAAALMLLAYWYARFGRAAAPDPAAARPEANSPGG